MNDWAGANLLEMKPRYIPAQPVSNSVEGRSITQCSYKAMKRLKEDLAKLDKSIPAFTFALTYGDKFPPASQARVDLNKLNRWINKKFSSLGFHYKREPQERGATHFHYLFQNHCEENARDVAFRILLKWCQIANLRFGSDQFEKSLKVHLKMEHVSSRVGTKNDRSNFQRVRGKNFFNYLGKYLSKGSGEPPSDYDLEGGGKWWGRVNRKAMRFVDVVVSETSDEEHDVNSIIERSMYKLRQKRAQVSCDTNTFDPVEKGSVYSFNSLFASTSCALSKALKKQGIKFSPKELRKLTIKVIDPQRRRKKARKLPRFGSVKLMGNTDGICDAFQRLRSNHADHKARARIFGDAWENPGQVLDTPAND